MTSSGSLEPELASSGAELVEPPADDHDASRSRANATNASATRVRARPVADASEISRVDVEPVDARLGEPAGGELRLDRGPRDERHAVPGLDRAPHRLLQAELEPHVEIAQPDALSPQRVLDDLPNAGSLLHEDERLRRAARRA